MLCNDLQTSATARPLLSEDDRNASPINPGLNATEGGLSKVGSHGLTSSNKITVVLDLSLRWCYRLKNGGFPL